MIQYRLFRSIKEMRALLLILLLLSFALCQIEYTKTELNSNWQMRLERGPPNTDLIKAKTFKTNLPTTVHLDLLAAGEIPDPFLKQNYPLIKWVSDCDYKYSLNFTVPDAIFKHHFHKLVFEGIDTYAQVKLNNMVVITAANAFRQYSVYVEGVLKQGVNTLSVEIKSTGKPDEAGQQTEQMPFAYAHTRKPGYQYSWDWAPYLNTMGIWKNVYLESFNEVKIDYVWVRTRSIAKEKAVVNFAIALELPDKELSNDYEFKILQDGEEVATIPAKQVHTYYDVPVQKPKLWWPNGMGVPHIYQFHVQLNKISDKSKVDERRIPFGIRTVALDLSDKKFQVKVNGYSIYCKGANYVPPDMFYPRLENSAYKPGNTIQALLDAAVDSHFNMIRVWGGGQYQSDKFLQMASRKGIMLFYDFMFSDSIYPSNEAFLMNVEEQVKQQIRRARNYPALTLWSGNNEILQGINDWGWNQQRYKADYHKLFQILIPKIIQYESPYIPYIPSSPIYGVGNHGLERGGDVHYWAVWAGGANFESYQSQIGRFNSEFGTQALPVWQTIIETMTENPSYENGALLLHERHNSRFNTLKSYMDQYMKKSVNFQMETYQSGLLQAFAIELAIVAQRISKPKSFGTLYWQFNDAWPAISWSSIDYLGRWKPLQFMAKRLYPDVAIYTLQNKIYAVSDKLYQVKALAVIQFFHLNGTLLNRVEKQVVLSANQVKPIYQISDGADYKGAKKADCMIYTEIVAGKGQVMSSTSFNVRFKDLILYPVTIQVQYNPQFNEVTLKAKTVVVKNLFISHKQKYLKVSNNYFDLLPGHPVKVIIQNKEGLQQLKRGLVFRSYREVYEEGSKVQIVAIP